MLVKFHKSRALSECRVPPCVLSLLCCEVARCRRTDSPPPSTQCASVCRLSPGLLAAALVPSRRACPASASLCGSPNYHYHSALICAFCWFSSSVCCIVIQSRAESTMWLLDVFAVKNLFSVSVTTSRSVARVRACEWVRAHVSPRQARCGSRPRIAAGCLASRRRYDGGSTRWTARTTASATAPRGCRLTGSSSTSTRWCSVVGTCPQAWTRRPWDAAPGPRPRRPVLPPGSLHCPTTVSSRTLTQVTAPTPRRFCCKWSDKSHREGGSTPMRDWTGQDFFH